jgi:outer membrane beta-barrel protein
MLARAVALSLALAALPRAAAASEADAFENKVAPISGQLYRKSLRLELTPIVTLSLNDAFYSKVLLGARLGYHLSEFFSVSGSFATGPSTRSGATEVCPINAGCSAASASQLNQLPGKIRAMGGVELAFSPIYGKLNVLAEKVIHFDLSLLGGPDWISYQQVLSGTEAAAGQAPSDGSTVGGHLGVGVRIFLAEFLAARLELKDYLYAVPIQDKSTLQNQLFAELGFSVFFPFRSAATP